KALCEVMFTPMIKWVSDACLDSGFEEKNITIVVGYKKEDIMDFMCEKFNYREQKQLLGTGDAVKQCLDILKGSMETETLILCGDAPFIDKETILGSLKQHKDKKNICTVVTANLRSPYGYGRIVKKSGEILKITEEKDATNSEKEITEVNSGVYWFNTKKLISVLSKINNNNAQGEFYLTDTVSILLDENERCGTFLSENENIVLGANTKLDLINLNKIAKTNILNCHLNNGVEFIDFENIYISKDVKIGKGTFLLPGTILKGNTEIGENCVIGPNTLIENSEILNSTNINNSQVYESIIKNNVKIGPYCHIRPNSVINDNVKIGDFVEIKNSTLDEKTSVSHLTYIGDSHFGKNVNVGCGVVTVNYDGENKFKTIVGDNCFIGCNTNLVAPVKLENNSYTAAGSTITENVKEGSLAIERGVQKSIDHWANKKLEKYIKKANENKK
ncbi:MAG: bifunctional UDP-N-acetylglucosamine diphosphorylase/glucosamine-1-phosphate N-acetyltransferase GlmU, partial [Oscillospiraceae bacterium]